MFNFQNVLLYPPKTKKLTVRNYYFSLNFRGKVTCLFLEQNFFFQGCFLNKFSNFSLVCSVLRFQNFDQQGTLYKLHKSNHRHLLHQYHLTLTNDQKRKYDEANNLHTIMGSWQVNRCFWRFKSRDYCSYIFAAQHKTLHNAGTAAPAGQVGGGESKYLFKSLGKPFLSNIH